MKDISIYLSPYTVKDEVFKNSFGANVSHFTSSINLSEFDLVLLGVEEERGTNEHSGCGSAPDKIRQQLYALTYHFKNFKILDLGNVKAGESLEDTHYAVSEIVTELVKNDCVVVILGGSQDLTYAQYMAYEELEQKVDLVVIDSHFDLDDSDEDTVATNSISYLNKIFLHQPNYLFNFSNLGYQTYFVNQDSLRVMDKLFFDAQRLGEISGAIHISEPAIRNADMISFDISSVRASDAMANGNAGPNGFYGEEACQMAKYAGYSDKLSSIGFYEFNPAYDQNGQTAMLLAQMIWCFLDGYYSRKKDIPSASKTDYLIYKASLKEDGHELIFIKSKKTDRWWMQVPYPTMGSKNERYHLVPCLYEDYQLAVIGEMPDLWWRTYQKLN